MPCDVQHATVEALRRFVCAYLLGMGNKSTCDIVPKYLGQLTDANVAARRGSALALGVLPFEFLANQWKVVLLKLCSCCEIEVKVTFVASRAENLYKSHSG